MKKKKKLILQLLAHQKDNNDDGDDANERDYQIKLSKAQEAIATAEEARKKLLLLSNNSEEEEEDYSNKTTKQQQPSPNSLARIEFTDADTLIITLPPKGFGTSSLFTGAFSLAWFSTIIPATLAAAAASSGGSLLFLLPFWAAGGVVAKDAIYDPFVAGRISIGQYAWEVENIVYGGRKVTSKEGPTEQLRGAKADVVGIVNGIPQAEVKLYTDKGVTAFGLGLSIEELEYLSSEINDHLNKLRSMPSIS